MDAFRQVQMATRSGTTIPRKCVLDKPQLALSANSWGNTQRVGKDTGMETSLARVWRAIARNKTFFFSSRGSAFCDETAIYGKCSDARGTQGISIFPGVQNSNALRTTCRRCNGNASAAGRDGRSQSVRSLAAIRTDRDSIRPDGSSGSSQDAPAERLPPLRPQLQSGCEHGRGHACPSCDGLNVAGYRWSAACKARTPRLETDRHQPGPVQRPHRS